MWPVCTDKSNYVVVGSRKKKEYLLRGETVEYDVEGDLPCICQTFRGAISLVLSTKCFLNSFNCSFNSG